MNCEFFTRYRIQPSLRILYTKIQYQWEIRGNNIFFYFTALEKLKQNRTKLKINSRDALQW